MNPVDLLVEHFGPGGPVRIVTVPGRVNLIGEHIDYHDLAVLPVAIRQCVQVAFRKRDDRRIRSVSAERQDAGDFLWTSHLEPGAAGDWQNYVKAAAQAVQGQWSLERGIDLAVVSDLPLAAGLSSSSALLVGVTLALLHANDLQPGFEELMEVLPEGEYFVGTRGGGMDHATVLAARQGCALLIRFAPLATRAIPIPPGWAFLAAHSLTTAEKSSALSAEYNARRTAGTLALAQMGLSTYRQALATASFAELAEQARHTLTDEPLRCFLHVTGEAVRVDAAVAAMEANDPVTFGKLLDESQASLRDWLRVSTTPLDTVTQIAREAGALGARLTGAGFGGFAVILCRENTLEAVREDLIRRFYDGKDFDARRHLFRVEPSDGALFR